MNHIIIIVVSGFRDTNGLLNITVTNINNILNKSQTTNQ